MEHTDIEEEILSAEVKRFQAVPEIRHKEWQKRGLMKPLQPEETPEYNFSDLQMSIYHTITNESGSTRFGYARSKSDIGALQKNK